MNQKVFHPKPQIKGGVTVPASKSYAQRIIALLSLYSSGGVIQNIGHNNDVKAALNVIKSLGAVVKENQQEIHIQTGINRYSNSDKRVFIGESGLSTRLFSAFSLLFENQNFEVKGEGSILNRSMKMVIEGLEAFGKKVSASDEKLPLIISGRKTENNIAIDGSESSQFLTGLLIVCPFLKEDTRLHVSNLKSKPYIDMTLGLLTEFGIEIQQENHSIFTIKGNQKISTTSPYFVEGDWSNAAFLLVAAAIGGEVKLKGLNKNSWQGDRKIVDYIQRAGAKLSWKEDVLEVQKEELIAFTADLTETPDLFPPLTVLACFSKGTSVLKGVHRLYEKESNRAKALIEECKKVGISITIKDDSFHIEGQPAISINDKTTFHSHNDHRIAMAMSLFSIGSHYPITIQNADAVDKSYPDFYTDFNQIG